MKKICFLCGDISLCGGTEKVACQIASGLSNDYRVYILSLYESNNNTFFDLSSIVKRSCLFGNPINAKKDAIRVIFGIRAFVKKHKIDLIIDVDTFLDIFSIPAIFGLKTKVISWEHFSFNESLGNKYRLFVKKYITRFSDCIITLTKEDQRKYKKALRNHHKIVQIYNPIKVSKCNSTYQIDSKTIISVGRLSYEKGFDLLVDVAKNVFAKHTDWKWIILGEGTQRRVIENKLKCNSIVNVKLLGQVKYVKKYLDSSSIYVLTSRSEGLGLVILEAKNSGLPVVSFNCEVGPSELVIDNVNGYLVDCFDIGMMSDRIIDLIENKEKRLLFSKNSLLKTDEFDFGYVLNKWKKVIESLF